MAEATVLEAPDTIAPAEEAPSETEETELAAPVETEASDDYEDSPLAGLPDEEIEKIPEVRKRLEAERYQREQAIKDARESAAREAATAAQRAEQKAGWERLQAQASTENRNRLMGVVAGEINRLKKAAENGEDAQANWQQLAAAVDGLGLQDRTRTATTMTDALFAYQREFYPDHRVDPDVLSAVESAKAQHRPEQMLQLWLIDHDVAVREQAIKEYEARRAAERAGNAAVDGKADRARQQAETRAAQPRPTNIGGAALPRGFQPKSIQELDAAIEDGRVQLPRGPSSRAAYERLAKGLPWSR